QYRSATNYIDDLKIYAPGSEQLRRQLELVSVSSNIQSVWGWKRPGEQQHHRGYIIEQAIDSRLDLMDYAAPEASSASLLEFFTCPVPLLSQQLLAGRRCSNFESKETEVRDLGRLNYPIDCY
ncbi:hypothetical protein HHI36_017197, partial [Cryptolaemus montrouzieri]